MAIRIGHTCPHCQKLELVIDLEAGHDVPNGPSSMYTPGGYVVRCGGAVAGECDSPDMTGHCRSKEEALSIAVKSLSDWEYLINSLESLEVFDD